MKTLLLLLFLPFIYGSFRPDIAKCQETYTGTIVNLGSDEAIYFESEIYPLYHPYCQQLFNRTDGNENGFVFIFTNGLVDYFRFIANANPESLSPTPLSHTPSPTFTPEFDISKQIAYKPYTYTSSLGFQMVASSYSIWTAFQGIVYAPPVGGIPSNCFLNSEVFNIMYSNQIIPLISFGNATRFDQCIWQINIPNSMALKVVVKNKQDNENLSISIDNGAPQLLGNDMVSYHNGTSFIVIYEKPVTPINQTFSMVALVSAVLLAEKKEMNCATTFADETTIIQLQNNITGYPSNTFCDVPLTSLENKRIYLDISAVIEPMADKIIIKDSMNNVYDLNGKKSILLSQSQNYTFHFESDENTNTYGFTVKKSYIDCTCNQIPKVINCNGDPFYLTNNIPSYCSSMNCEFDVFLDQSCPEEFFFFKVTTQLRDKDIDRLEISLNGESIHNTTSSALKTFGRLFPKNQTLHVKFTSGSDFTNVYLDVPHLSFSSILSNSSQSTLLTAETPVYRALTNLYSDPNVYLVVEAPANYTLDLFYFGKSYGDDLYDGDFLVGPLYNPRGFYDSAYLTSYSSTTGQFRIPRTTGGNFNYFFRLREIHAKSCSDKDNVLVVNTDFSGFYVRNDGETQCLTTLLLYDTNSRGNNFIFSGISLSSKATFYAGIDFDYPIITVDNNSQIFTNLFLVGSYVSILMPKNSWINTDINTYFYNINKSSIYPPIYDDPRLFINEINHYKLATEARKTVELQVKLLDLGENDSLFVNINGVNQLVTQINQTFIGQIEYLTLHQETPGKRGFLAEYWVTSDNLNTIPTPYPIMNSNTIGLNAILLMFSCTLLLIIN